MSWSQKENAVREKRTMEATKKNFMGPSGRLGIIAKFLGTPIIRQGSGLYDVNFLEDPYDDSSDIEYETTASNQKGPMVWQDDIPVMEDDFIREEGYLFDGLSRGIHMEIKYWHDSHKLEVSYKGYPVYKEIAGELSSYAPHEEWEELIKTLYKLAKKRKENKADMEEAEISDVFERKKTNFWNKLKTRWGV